ncbi:MAG TPA: YdcF family protein [Verrucomicrobiae bacterium]|nr:YdcF family protein [Verrucomicrobiae bacterium]
MANGIKIALGAFADPIGWLWIGLIAACVLQFAKRRWPGGLLCLAMAAGIATVVFTPVTDGLMAGLERPYARADLHAVTNADAVVMLGGVLVPSDYDASGFDFSAAGDRVITALELTRDHKAKTLVLGGAAMTRRQAPAPEGQFLNGWIQKWALTPAKVIVMDGSANTREEAEKVLNLVKTNQWKQIILVTSAFHLKRAEATFKNLGINVIPVGCDFRAARGPEGQAPFKVALNWGRVDTFRLYLHEKISWYYYRWQGWIKDGA